MNLQNDKSAGASATRAEIPYRDIRGLIYHLERNGQLLRIKKAVSPRYTHTLLAQSDKAVLFENVVGYSVPVVEGLVGFRRRLALGLASDEINLKDLLVAQNL